MNIDEIKWISRFERLSTINNNLDWSDSKFTHEVWCWDNTKRDTHIKLHMYGRDFWWCPEFCPKEKAFYAGDNKPLQYFDEINRVYKEPKLGVHYTEDGRAMVEYLGTGITSRFIDLENTAIFMYENIIKHCDHNDHVGREESLKELNKDKEKVINERNK